MNCFDFVEHQYFNHYKHEVHVLESTKAQKQLTTNNFNFLPYSDA